MKEDFNYKQVPPAYTQCLHAQCPRSSDCLRYLVTLHAGPEIKRLSVINPASVRGKEDVCPYFQQDRMACFARGITHLYDNIPYAKAVNIKRMICRNLERNTYYRIKRKERLINPDELSLIVQAFRKEGIDEDPVFDELIYKYNWVSNT